MYIQWVLNLWPYSCLVLKGLIWVFQGMYLYLFPVATGINYFCSFMYSFLQSLWMTLCMFCHVNRLGLWWNGCAPVFCLFLPVLLHEWGYFRVEICIDCPLKRICLWINKFVCLACNWVLFPYSSCIEMFVQNPNITAGSVLDDLDDYEISNF